MKNPKPTGGFLKSHGPGVPVFFFILGLISFFSIAFYDFRAAPEPTETAPPQALTAPAPAVKQAPRISPEAEKMQALLKEGKLRLHPARYYTALEAEAS